MCSDDDRLLANINEARRLLYPLGDWKGTTEGLCIKSCKCYLTLPSIYEYAKTAYICRRKVSIVNDWFTPINEGDFDYYLGNSVGRLVQVPGRFVTIQDWYDVKECNCNPEGFYIKVILEHGADKGIHLHFKGVGAHRREVSLTRECNEDAHVPILAAQGEKRMKAITFCEKPVTRGRIRVYGYDGTNERLLAIYDPDDINPEYTRYNVRGCRYYMVKAKKRFKEIQNDDHALVDINPDGLIHALHAITDRKARNYVGMATNIQLATQFLNKELGGPESTSTSPLQMSDAYRVEGLI